MKRLDACRLIGLAAVLLLGAEISRAAIQGKDTVCWMGIDGWQLREVDGEPRLVEFGWNKFDWRPKEKRHRWYVGAPTITAESGKFLASDPAGREPSVRLTENKGAHTQWVFEIVSRLQ